MFSAEVNEHNALYDEWQKSEADAVRLGRDNDVLCDKIFALEAKIAELESRRVPFTDAQIEKMARAACNTSGLGYSWGITNMRQDWRSAIRAALAAGGLEPCPVPEYNPDDVAFGNYKERALNAEAASRALRDENDDLREKREYEVEVSERLRTELAAVKAEREKCWQILNDARLDGIPPTFKLDSAVKHLVELAQRQSVPVKVWWDVSDERLQTSVELGTLIRLGLDKIAHLREVFAAHAVIDVPAGVPGTPELREIGVNAYLSHEAAKRENVICMVDPMAAAATAIRDYFAPWLRTQLGWELDVDPKEMYTAWYKCDLGYGPNRMKAVLDLCRDRIRPVMECKECAAKEAELRRHNEKWTGFIQRCQADAQNARAALEGE